MALLLAGAVAADDVDATDADIRGEHPIELRTPPGGVPMRCVYRGDAENRPVEVACYRPPATEPFQRIDLAGLETPYRGARPVVVADMDRDGADDLRVLLSWGATGNLEYADYLWSSEEGRFVEAPELAVCREPLDDRGCCSNRSTGGMAGNVYVESTHCLRDGRLVEVERVRQDWSDEDRCFHRTRLERRGDELEAVGTEIHCDPDWP